MYTIVYKYIPVTIYVWYLLFNGKRYQFRFSLITAFWHARSKATPGAVGGVSRENKKTFWISYTMSANERWDESYDGTASTSTTANC